MPLEVTQIEASDISRSAAAAAALNADPLQVFPATPVAPLPAESDSAEENRGQEQEIAAKAPKRDAEQEELLRLQVEVEDVLATNLDPISLPPEQAAAAGTDPHDRLVGVFGSLMLDVYI